jgi:hypothetical protein
MGLTLLMLMGMIAFGRFLRIALLYVLRVMPVVQDLKMWTNAMEIIIKITTGRHAFFGHQKMV